VETRNLAVDTGSATLSKSTPWRFILAAAALLIATSGVARADDGFDLPPDAAVTLPPDDPAPPPAATTPPPATTPTPPPPTTAPTTVTESNPAPTTPPAEKSTTVQTMANPEEGFTSRTAALEEQVNNLNQMVQATKFRLLAMGEDILGSGMTSSGAKLAVWHRNELGSSYVITGIVYVLDGTPIYTKVDESGALGTRDEFVILDSRVLPGPHQLAVQYDLRGHGFGIFSYLEELRLTLRKSLSFNVEPGKVTRITGAAFEKGPITLEFKDRPDINFEQTVTKEVLKPSAENSETGGEAGATTQAGADK
jgi:hypothetical protein